MEEAAQKVWESREKITLRLWIRCPLDAKVLDDQVEGVEVGHSFLYLLVAEDEIVSHNDHDTFKACFLLYT